LLPFRGMCGRDCSATAYASRPLPNYAGRGLGREIPLTLLPTGDVGADEANRQNIKCLLNSGLISRSVPVYGLIRIDPRKVDAVGWLLTEASGSVLRLGPPAGGLERSRPRTPTTGSARSGRGFL
jgi:hypothetical protein